MTVSPSKRSIAAATSVLSLVLLAGCSSSSKAASPQSFPQSGKTIEWVVPSAPGGANDILARIMAPSMSETLGATVNVVNKEGGSQVIGLDYAAKSDPDGYTMVYTNVPSILGRYLDPGKNASFDRSSFTPVGSFASNSVILAVPKDSPYGSVADLFTAVKAAPGTIIAGTDSRAGDDHVNLRVMEKDLGLDFNIVHYNSGADKVTALLGGEVDFAIGGIGSFFGQYKSGDVKLLAIVQDEPNPLFPEVPTLASQGFEVAPMVNNFAVSVPAGTPAETVTKLGEAMKAAAENPAVKDKLAATAAQPGWIGGAQVATLWADREAELGPVIKELLDEQG